MRVAIEALGIHYAGGGRSATLNLMESLFRIDPVNEYLVILTVPEPSLAVFAVDFAILRFGALRQESINIWHAHSPNRYHIRSHDTVISSALSEDRCRLLALDTATHTAARRCYCGDIPTDGARHSKVISSARE